MLRPTPAKGPNASSEKEYVPAKGDIICIDFDPSAGREIMKERPAFVISHEVLNDRTGFAIVAPITNTNRGTRLEVKLTGLQTTGVIVVPQLRSLDFSARRAKFIEKAPDSVSAQVSEIAKLLVS